MKKTELNSIKSAVKTILRQQNVMLGLVSTLWYAPKKEGGKLGNLVGELQSIVEVARESWKTTTGSPNHVVEGVG